MIQALLYSIQFKQKFILLLIIKFIFYLGSKYLLTFIKSAWVNFTNPKSKHIIKYNHIIKNNHIIKSVLSTKQMVMCALYGIGVCIVKAQECTILGERYSIRDNHISKLNEPVYTKLAEGVLLTNKGHVTVTKQVMDIPHNPDKTLTIFTEPEGTFTKTVSKTFGRFIQETDSACPATTVTSTVTSMIRATVTKTVTETLTSSPSPINTPEGASCDYKRVSG